MEYILQQEALAKGLDPALLKSNDFSHLIVKGARDDEFMYLSVMVRRLTHCCPYHPPPEQKEDTTPQSSASS